MIQPSELILNRDGTIFHLHLKPEQIADTILLVGDQGRVESIGNYFDNVECNVQNREFKSITGTYNGTRFTVLSTGIGTDNIDIVVNELDALANIDLTTREIKKEHKTLNLIRIGTSGSMQPDIPINSFLISKKSIGFDGLLNFYAGRDAICDLEFEREFVDFTKFGSTLAAPYVVDCSSKLFDKISCLDTLTGVNISAPGFYGPQGRILRLNLLDNELNEKIEKFRFKGMKITNYEMESSAIYGLSKLLGHEALTVCLVIANRVLKQANENYYAEMDRLIKLVLNKLSK